MKKGFLGVLLVVFLVFSYFKFFTIRVSFMEDPTVAIVKTGDVNILSNTRVVNEGEYSSTWYSDNGYEILYADEHGGNYKPLHEGVILAWWGILGYLIFLVTKRLRKA